MGAKKPLDKIKRKALWPDLVGFVVVCVVFVIIAYFITDIFSLSMLEEKSRESYETALYVKSYFDENNKALQSVCTVNSENEILWQSDNNKPDFQNNLEYKLEDCIVLFDHSIEDFFTQTNDIDFFFKVYLQLVPHDNNLILNWRHILMDSKTLKLLIDIVDNRYRTITSVPCWVVLNEDEAGNRFCVNTEISLRVSELVPFFLLISIFVVFLLILILWFIVSSLRLHKDRHQLEKILALDPVTGGMNWVYFVKTGTRLLKRKPRKNKHYAVVSFAMRHFTNYCTYYGVSSGEELLGKFYSILQECVGKKELAVRHERAEFGLLLLFEDEAELEQRLTKIMFMLNSVAADQSFHFSTGVYIIDKNEDNITEIYNSAVVARNRYSDDATKQICYFSDELYKEQVWERKVENDMEKALYNHEFELYLQPKYDTKSETLSAAEALVRWNHPTEGCVPPGKFIPIFESNGFIIQLDDYMLTEVCRMQATWIARNERIVPISVNVSRAHFAKDDLAERICKIVDTFKVPHSVIELELTESAFFDDKKVLLSTVKKLKDAGFKISMDDFGAGYSSLNTLKELPLDVIKLDAEFFRGKDEMNRGKLIVEETINLAKKLAMTIVAEGIENREQVNFLKNIGCDLIQGYYFAKPLSVAEFEKRAFKKTTA